jgi:hypothetical protein
MFLANLISGASAVATGIAAYVVWHFSVRADRAATFIHNLASLSEIERWRADLREWSGEVVDLLSECESVCEASARGESPSDRERCRYRLSGLLDRGRHRLPNQDKKLYGANKQYSYQGYRHAALDPLMAAIRILDGDANLLGVAPARRLYEMRQVFVSRIELLLRPDLRNTEIVRLLERTGRDKGEDPSFGGLLAEEGVIPAGEGALLAQGQAEQRKTILPAA